MVKRTKSLNTSFKWCAMNQSMNKKQRNLLLAILVLWLATAGGLVYVFLENQELRSQLTATEAEKQEVKQELENLYEDYDTLKTDNDSISAELNRKKKKIQKMMEEIENVKNASAWEIAQYKEEIQVMRKIMRSYVRTIDSLNTLNQELQAENQTVKNEYKKVKTSYEQAQEEKEELSGKVKKAEKLKFDSYYASGIRNNGKEADWPMFIKKIKVCFTLDANELAPKGKRTAYVRIVRPDDFIMIRERKNLFTYNDKKIAYSAKTTFNYQGQEKEVCIYYDLKEKPASGKYNAAIFLEGKKITEVPFKIK